MTEPGHASRRLRLLTYGLCSLLTVVLPLVVWTANWPVARCSYGKSFEPFELFGLFGTLALAGFGVTELRHRRGSGWEYKAPVIGALVVGFFFLNLMALVTIKSIDYRNYEEGAAKVLAHANPYGSTYLYPPLTAQVLALLYSLPDPEAFTWAKDKSQYLWTQVFYLFQAAQYFLVLGAYFMFYRFGRDQRLRRWHAAALAAGLLVLSNPVLGSWRENQVNFWVLDSILLALLLVRRRPYLAGAALAVGVHIKLYPVILVLPWLLSRRWRPIAGAVAGFLLILLVQGLGSGWELWREFLAHLEAFPRYVNFRNSGVQGIVYNLFYVGSLVTGGDSNALEPAIKAVSVLASLGVAAWFGTRFFARERAVRSLFGSPAGEAARELRQDLDSLDAVALSLIVSPLIWPHHFVLALPLIIWAAAWQRQEKPLPLVIGAGLILAVPGFDFFLLSYHHLVGLVLLLFVASPAALVSAARRAAGEAPAEPLRLYSPPDVGST